MDNQLKNKFVELGIEFEIINHEASGKTTFQAEKALNEKKENILKSILLKNEANQFLGVIILGNSKINFSKVKEYTKIIPYFQNNKFSFCSPEIVKQITGYEIGGVPPIVFLTKNIRTIVDLAIFNQNYVIGAGGNEYTGIKIRGDDFKKLGYAEADISSKES